MIEINWLYDQYVVWASENKVECVASKESMCKAFQKLFGKQKLKSVQRNKDAKYNYKNFLFVKDDVREAMDSKVKLVTNSAIDFEHELVSIEMPSNLMLNGEMAVFKCIYSRNTGFYRLLFRDIELASTSLGLSSYSSWDQMFVTGIYRVSQGFVLCRGRKVSLPKGRKESGNLMTALISEVGPHFDEDVVTFSKNCLGVLPITCELKNNTCTQCIHDINQRIRQLKTTKFLTKDEADALLTKDRRSASKRGAEFQQPDELIPPKQIKMEPDDAFEVTEGQDGNSEDLTKDDEREVSRFILFWKGTLFIILHN